MSGISHNKHSLPGGTRIYAIGDIHGVLQPLLKLHRLIEQEERNRPPAEIMRIIYLGDYIDRGKESKQVIDLLIMKQKNHNNCIFLKGNHEHGMLQFLIDPERHAAWLKWGGVETIASYGIDTFEAFTKPNALPYLAERLKEAIPAEHKLFYESLKTLHEEDNYIFVHAGLRPGVALAEQKEQDLLTIRESFIETNFRFDKQVVFGHTIFKAPYHKNGKIGIDTGAYMTGRLTCAVIEKNRVDFLTT